MAPLPNDVPPALPGEERRSEPCPPGTEPEECSLMRRVDDNWREWATSSIKLLEEGQQSLARKVDENTAITTNIDNATAEIITAFRDAKGFFAVARWVGLTAKWVTYIAGAIAALWALAKYGGPPPGKGGD